MNALVELKKISRDTQANITVVFGSTDKLYTKVPGLLEENNAIYHRLAEYRVRLKQIREEMYEIEDDLNEIGINGLEIITTISNDQRELTNKLIEVVKL